MQHKEEDIWPSIWRALENYGDLEFDNDRITFTVDRAKEFPLAKRVRSSSIFHCNTVSAKAKGWKWSGDTDIGIYAFSAPSLAEAVQASIVTFALTRGNGTFETNREDLGDYSFSFRNWTSLWESAVNGYETGVLKNAKGGPDKVIVLITNGNARLTLAQQGTTYYLIDYCTS